MVVIRHDLSIFSFDARIEQLEQILRMDHGCYKI